MAADLFEAQKEEQYLNLVLGVNSDVLYLHGNVFHPETLEINPYFQNGGNSEMQSSCVNRVNHMFNTAFISPIAAIFPSC